MSTIEELEAEVLKLGREIRRLRGTPEREVVREIVGGEPTRPDGLSGFSAACRDSQAVAARDLEARIEKTLRSDPALVATPHLEAEFCASYPTVTPSKMAEIIRRVRRDV